MKCLVTRSCLTLFLLFSMLTTSPLFAPAQSTQDTLQYSRVKVFFDDEHTIKDLAKLGLPADHGQFKKGVFLVTDYSENEIRQLDTAGFNYKILIPDVKAFYKERNRQDKKKGRTSRDHACNNQNNYTTPNGFSLGSMGGYFTYQEMLDHLDTMAARYPSLITARQSINGDTTFNGNTLYYVKISDNPTVDENEPEVLYTALHHAREPASLSNQIFYMYYLLENYGSDPAITYLVDSTEMYFVPCVNPDGYLYNEQTDPNGGGLWRKNRRDNGNGTYGVDLNRNYGHKWGYDNNGSSPNPGSQVYRGDSAFSEPETQMVRDLALNHNFRMALNYHTYGNLLIYPWGYIASFLTPDSNTYIRYGHYLTRENNYLWGTGDQTVGYVVNGDSDDWMYGEQSSKNKIFSMTPEVGSQGFWPPSSEIIQLCKDNMWQNLKTAFLVHNYGLLTPHSPHLVDTLRPRFVFEFQRIGLDSGQFWVTLQPLDSAMQQVTDTIFYDSLDLLETRWDTLPYSLDSCVMNGQQYRFLAKVNNGTYTFTDTITRFYGEVLQAFNDEVNNNNKWFTNGWGLSSNTFHSSPYSWTDSPGSSYNNNQTDAVTTDGTIDLTGAEQAYLTFWARWEIESGYDYVQVKVSPDGTNWTPLCGKYTRAGSSAQDQGQPVYDGKQKFWVRERIDLHQFLGQQVYLRFELVSDGFVVKDGFYFDDVTIHTIPKAGGLITSDTAVCQGDSVQFQNGGDYAGAQWYVEQQLQDTAAAFVYRFDSAGTFTVKMVTTCNNLTDTSVEQIRVDQGLTTAQFNYTVSGNTVDFTSTETKAVYYDWDFGDSNSSSDANPTHLYSSSGTYTVCLENGNACDTMQHCETITISGIEETSPVAFKLVPQPAHDQLTIYRQGRFEGPVEWTLYNMLGEPVVTRMSPRGESAFRVHTAQLPAGLYFIEMKTDRTTLTRKVVIQH